jgi:hypothetical protein
MFEFLRVDSKSGAKVSRVSSKPGRHIKISSASKLHISV